MEWKMTPSRRVFTPNGFVYWEYFSRRWHCHSVTATNGRQLLPSERRRLIAARGLRS